MTVVLTKLDIYYFYADYTPEIEGIITETVKKTIEVNGQKLLVGSNLTLDDKIQDYLNGVIPKLSLNDYKAIKSFLPFETKLKLEKLSYEVYDEIDLNILNISNDNQLKRYLLEINQRLKDTVSLVKKYSKIEKIKSNIIYHNPLPIINNLSEEDKKATNALFKLIVQDNFEFYNNYQNTLDYIEDKIFELGINKEGEKIIESSQIIRLKGLFDGILWEEDIKDEDFISFWRTGTKLKYLPLKPKVINKFLSLLYRYYNPNFSYSILEQAFDITDIKGKRGKLKDRDSSSIFIKKIMGNPEFSVKGQKG